MINPIWAKTPEIEKELEKVNEIILKKIDLKNKKISDLIKLQINSGGKMLRPAFLLLFSKFGNEADHEKILNAAAAIELLHLATLIHDDVIDDSGKRRDVETIQVHAGQRDAIYAGDYLMTIYFETISRVANNNLEIILNAKSMKKILMGELDQMLINRNVDATVKMYLREIWGKTAQLLELSAEFGALLGNADQRLVHHAKYIGHDIGMAFQIEDDILDYDNHNKTGKPTLEDLRNGVYSIPLIYAIQNGDLEFKEYLKNHPKLNEDEIKYVAEKVEQFGGIESSRKLAEKYTKKAIILIDELPHNKNQKYLKKITTELLKRNN